MIHTLLGKITSLIIAPFILIGGLFTPNVQPTLPTPDFNNPPVVGATLPQATGVFETSLAAPITSTATTMTLTSNAVRGGGSISGYACFTLDEGSAQAEVACGTVSSTTVSSMTRGVSYADGVTSVSANKFAHRRGANVKITDFPILQILKAQNNGDATFPNPIKYETGVAPSTADDLADKGYVDGVAIAGGADASTTVKGIGKTSVAPASATNPIFVGDNDPRVPTQAENDAQIGNNTDVAVGSGNKYVTQTGLQHNAEKYAADAGSNDTYVITLSPAPTSYTNGMVVHFKANTVNTGAATININSLGAKTIVKGVNTTLADGDIGAGQLLTLIYDGTNFVLQSPSATAGIPTDIQIFTSNGTWTKPSGAIAVEVITIGGGGGGGGGASVPTNNYRQGGSGGGGGAITRKLFNASDLTSTVAVTVAATANGGTGGTGNGAGGQDGSAGTAGNSSSFGSYLVAYGGGAGAGGAQSSGDNAEKSGGAGGGSGTIGQVGQSNASSLGGFPAITAGLDGVSTQGAGGTTTAAKSAEYGGASGGYSTDSNGSGAGAGGSSIFGAAGGGGGAGMNNSNTTFAAGAGGNVQTNTIGGGGAAGSSGTQGTAGTAGTAGDSTKLGTGGGGGGASTTGANNGGAGGAGGAPGGGGGGGGATTSTAGGGTGGQGGSGARGEVRVITFF